MNYKELLINRIQEERAVLKEYEKYYFTDGIKGFQRTLDEQFGYVCGLEHALRILEELVND